ncbi:T-box protein [Perilla frutescens var. frutescens]|nr:T-box protein [Perilla frutescens var. frutescens]
MSSSLPLKVALIFSISLAGAASSTTAAAAPFSFPRKLITNSSHSLSPNPKPKATASDLLSLLGPPDQAESVNSAVARDLWSCFKFLAPFNQTPPARRSLSSELTTPLIRSRKEIDELILSPPPPVLELARLAVDSGGDPGAIHRALDPTMIHVPDVEGSNEDRCELTRTPYGRQFIDEGLNSYLEFLFEIIVERGPSVGLHVCLSRYDFFHGHLFLAKESGRLGILFHAKEYPAYDKEFFPCNMGYCQVGSNVAYDDSMNLRNILWLAPLPSNSTKAWVAPGVLVVLDAHPEGIIYRDLIPEYVHFARTLYEEDFGEVVVDVNYLNVGAEKPKFQLFIC